MTKLIGAFRGCANVAKKDRLEIIRSYVNEAYGRFTFPEI